MYKVALIPVLMMGPCGYDMEAAGISVSDAGGLEVPYQLDDGGTAAFELPKDATIRPLPDFPPMEKICMLYIGDWNERTDYPKGVGTWINDVLDERFFGPIEGAGDYKDNDGAQLRYTYKHPEIPMETASLSLRFERAPMVDLREHSAGDGVPWPDPFFLSGVSIQGLGGDTLPCLDWILRDKPATHYTQCDWCSSFNVFQPCYEMDPRDCFR